MYLLSLEWKKKRVGVMDNDSGDNGTDELNNSVEKRVSYMYDTVLIDKKIRVQSHTGHSFIIFH